MIREVYLIRSLLTDQYFTKFDDTNNAIYTLEHAHIFTDYTNLNEVLNKLDKKLHAIEFTTKNIIEV